MEELQGHGGCALCLFECILEGVAALRVFIKLMELSCRQPWLEGSHNTTATHNVWCSWHASVEVHLAGVASMCRLHGQCWRCCVRSKKLGRKGESHINLLTTTPKTRWSCALCIQMHLGEVAAMLRLRTQLFELPCKHAWLWKKPQHNHHTRCVVVLPHIYRIVSWRSCSYVQAS